MRIQYEEDISEYIMKTDYKSKKYFVGSTFCNNQGVCANVIGKSTEKENYYYVQFLDDEGAVVLVNSVNLSRGEFKNPFFRSLYGVGYLGVGKYTGERQFSDIHSRWSNMIKRCYSKVSLKDRPTYEKVTVYEEWHNYQNFAEWYEDNYIDGYVLDKDLLQNGMINKVYSPSTCIFIPASVNSFLIDKLNTNTSGHKGVHFNKRKDKWMASICELGTGNTKHLGYYGTQDEAINSYNKKKEEYTMEVINEMKGLGYEDRILIAVEDRIK